jgi:hypothetical protein
LVSSVHVAMYGSVYHGATVLRGRCAIAVPCRGAPDFMGMPRASQLRMASQTRTPGKRKATKRVEKTGAQSKRASAAGAPRATHGSMQKRRTRGGADTVRKTAARQQTPSRAREKSRGRVASGTGVELYTQRTRAAISAALDGLAANIIAQARAISARGRRWLSQIKRGSLHMPQPLPKKYRIGAG